MYTVGYVSDGVDTRLIHGMTMNPVTLKWCWINNTSVNYALHAVKPNSSHSDTNN